MSEANHVDFISEIVKPLCNEPGSVVVKSMDDDKGTLINVWVDQQDMGRVIGKKGETVNAMRLLLKIFGMRVEKHFALKINAIE